MGVCVMCEERAEKALDFSSNRKGRNALFDLPAGEVMEDGKSPEVVLVRVWKSDGLRD